MSNQGQVASGATTTTYFLSPTTNKSDPGAVKVGTRSVPGLASGAATRKTVKVKVPLTGTVSKGTDYYLLVCPNDPHKAAYGPTNCSVSATQVTCGTCH